MDERQVVDAGNDAWQQVCGPMPALAMLLPIPGALQKGPWRDALEQLHPLARVELLAVAPGDLGLVVERVEVAYASRHEELHHPPGLRLVVQTAVHVG